MVIGYGFHDKHINKVIADSIKDHGLEVYVVSPLDPENFKNELNPKPYGKEIFSGLSGYFPYTLSDIFPTDQSTTHAWRIIEQSYFNT